MDWKNYPNWLCAEKTKFSASESSHVASWRVSPSITIHQPGRGGYLLRNKSRTKLGKLLHLSQKCHWLLLGCIAFVDYEREEKGAQIEWKSVILS